MTSDDLLERLATVRVHRAHGQRAPHKPLMLLVALGRVRLGSDQLLIPYTTAEARFGELWHNFGRPKGPRHVVPAEGAAPRLLARGHSEMWTSTPGRSGSCLLRGLREAGIASPSAVYDRD